MKYRNPGVISARQRKAGPHKTRTAKVSLDDTLAEYDMQPCPSTEPGDHDPMCWCSIEGVCFTHCRCLEDAAPSTSQHDAGGDPTVTTDASTDACASASSIAAAPTSAPPVASSRVEDADDHGTQA